MSDDLSEFIIKLPDIEFIKDEFDEKHDDEKPHPSIKDLCHEDRLRISKLIEELARCKENNEWDAQKIKEVQKENARLILNTRKIEKENSDLLSLIAQKETEVMGLRANSSMLITDYKCKISDLEQKLNLMTLRETRTGEKFKLLQNKTDELTHTIKKISDHNQQILIRYRNVKRKLKQAIVFVKKLIKNSECTAKKDMEDRSCQVIQKEILNNVNRNKKIRSESTTENTAILDIKLPPSNAACSLKSHTNSELSLLSDLFFKASSTRYDDSEAILFFPPDNPMRR